jgi:outer membrane protein TolC
MRKLLIILLLPVQLVFGQNEVALDDCYNWARDNYPNLKQAEIWKEITSLNQESIKTSFLPKVTLNAQATYQSDVTGIEIPIPNISIPSVSKDQYKAYAEFKQTIWDGGISEMNSKLEEAVLKNNLSRLEVEMYKLNEQISQAFFATLVVRKQADILTEQKKVLNEKLKFIESGIKNGILEKSNASILKAEILNLKQNEIQLEAGENAAINMISILTGKIISPESKFTFRQPDNTIDKNLHRPEFQLFANQTGQLETQIELLDKTRNPKLFGFGQSGYGKPGLNMLSDEFDAYYLVGVGISWNALDWKNTIRKKQVLQLQQQIVQTQQETFTQNIRILLSQQQEQISKLERMLENDKQMVMLRTDITKAAASKLENEIITTTDYIQELQAETIAKLNYELHKIQLNEAIEKHTLIQGK